MDCFISAWICSLCSSTSMRDLPAKAWCFAFRLDRHFVSCRGSIVRLPRVPLRSLAHIGDALRPRVRRIHLFPIEVSGQNPGVVQVERVDRENIPIEHDEICTLA